MRLKLKLVAASWKMFGRQRQSILWTLFLPLFMVFLFSFVNIGGPGTVSLGIVNHAHDTALVDLLRPIRALSITYGDEVAEMASLKNGDRALVLVISPTSGPTRNDSLTLYLNADRPQDAQTGEILIRSAMDQLALRDRQFQPPRPHSRLIRSRAATYVDFVLPGILALSIMNSGIFGVAMAFVVLRKRGVLRRLRVTPMQPNDFIIASVISRLTILMLQVATMVGAGILLFGLRFAGSLLDMLVMGVLGGVVFLGIGFALSGISESEEHVGPVANIITLPMMLLSGVFFGRSSLPGAAQRITEFFPLTYLADGLRKIAVEGATLDMVVPQLLGLTVWAVIALLLAMKAFRWE